MSLGVPELLILLFIVMLLFGSSRVPKLARSIGDALRELRSATRDDEDARTSVSDDRQV